MKNKSTERNKISVTVKNLLPSICLIISKTSVSRCSYTRNKHTCASKSGWRPAAWQIYRTSSWATIFHRGTRSTWARYKRQAEIARSRLGRWNGFETNTTFSRTPACWNYTVTGCCWSNWTVYWRTRRCCSFSWRRSRRSSKILNGASGSSRWSTITSSYGRWTCEAKKTRHVPKGEHWYTFVFIFA